MDDEKVPQTRPQRSKKWLQDMSKGLGHEVEALTLSNLKVEVAQKGLIRCSFIVPKHLTDKDGNWEVGAMAILIDDIGAAAISSAGGDVKASVDFNISFFSTAKIQEEVEIEAKAVGANGKLMFAVIEVKKKDNGERIALSKQWISTFNSKLAQPKL